MSEKTILVVDDEADIRDMLRIALEMADYRVIEADNAQSAHALAIDEQPDLILLDWMMPDMSGIELVRRLKRDDVTQ